MKRLIFAVALILSGIAAQAHEVNFTCKSNGVANFTASNGSNGLAIVTIIDSFGVQIGTWSLTFNLGSFPAGFTFSAPLDVNGNVRVKVLWADGTVNMAYSGTTTCSSLPIKLVNVQAENDGDYVKVSFTALEEVNVKYYKISISTDNGVTWTDKWIEFTGTTPKGNYIVKFKK